MAESQTKPGCEIGAKPGDGSGTMTRRKDFTLKRRKQKLPMWFKLVLGTMGGMSLVFLVNAVIGHGGLLELQNQQRRYEAIRSKTMELQEEVMHLERERLASEKDPLLRERIAREKLGLVREGEVVYILNTGEMPVTPGKKLEPLESGDTVREAVD